MQFNENCEELGEIGLKVLTETKFIKDRSGFRIQADRRSNLNSSEKQHQVDREEKDENPDRKDLRNKDKEEDSIQDAMIGDELDSKQDLIDKVWDRIKEVFSKGAIAANDRAEDSTQMAIQNLVKLMQTKAKYEQEMQQLTRTRPM